MPAFQASQRCGDRRHGAMTGRQRIAASGGNIITGSPTRPWKTTRCASPRKARGAGRCSASPIPRSAPSRSWRCEAIGGALTLSYGFNNAVAAILAVGALMLPDRAADRPLRQQIRRRHRPADARRRLRLYRLDHHLADLRHLHLHAVRDRGLDHVAGAGAVRSACRCGSAYIVCAVVVIPLVTHGIRLISRFQLWTQPFWIVLNILPFVFIALQRPARNSTDWTSLRRARPAASGGRASTCCCSAPPPRHPALLDAADRRAGGLSALPAAAEAGACRHASPGGRPCCPPAPAGSSSARRSCWPARSSRCWRCAHGVPPEHAAEPTQYVSASPSATCPARRRRRSLLTGIFVVISSSRSTS